MFLLLQTVPHCALWFMSHCAMCESLLVCILRSRIHRPKGMNIFNLLDIDNCSPNQFYQFKLIVSSVEYVINALVWIGASNLFPSVCRLGAEQFYLTLIYFSFTAFHGTKFLSNPQGNFAIAAHSGPSLSHQEQSSNLVALHSHFPF